MSGRQQTDRHPLDHRGRAIPDGSWPDGRPAPDGLELVRRFVNTTNRESGADWLESPEHFDRWLGNEGRRPLGVTDRDLGRLIDIREWIRDVLTEGDDGLRVGSAPPLSRPLTLRLRLQTERSGGFSLAPSEPDTVDALVAELATALAVATGTGSIRRLKTCTNDHCRWMYYDWSRNTGGRWCSMQACGGRHKARAYRRRTTGSVTATAISDPTEPTDTTHP